MQMIFSPEGNVLLRSLRVEYFQYAQEPSLVLGMVILVQP